MIGWRPYLLTVLAAVLLAVMSLDVSAGFHAPHLVGGADVGHRLHAALTEGMAWISHLGVLDWIIVGVAIALLLWAWVRARSLTALGSMTIDCIDEQGDPSLDCAAARATLEQELGSRGLLPPSGVPSGFPSATSVADAIAKAPLPEVGWLGALVSVIPLPQSCTGFKISGTLLKTTSTTTPFRFAYRLICIGPTPSVQLGAADGGSQEDAIVAAAREIYRHVARAAPDLYPVWARWRNVDALREYRKGLTIEQEVSPLSDADAPSANAQSPTQRDHIDPYRRAQRQYLLASEHDPDNMLARLRAANCLERIATNTAPSEEKRCRQADALAAYVSIRLRQPDIVEARFRASVLMSVLASEDEQDLQQIILIRASLSRLQRMAARRVDLHDAPDGTLTGSTSTSLKRQLELAARREAKETHRRLRPLWTIVHENRLRHLFEPRGRDRRQLRKALAMSRFAQHARAASRSDRPLLVNLRQVWWRAWVFWRYTAGRSELSGWQTHYNAACFYALLPQARAGARPRDSLRLRKRSLWHLQRAIDKADGALEGTYVRDEDPDLEVLRRLSPQRFAGVVRRICPNELTIHYRHRKTETGCELHVWGPACRVAVDQAREQTLTAVSSDKREAAFRVRIFDENQTLSFHVGQNGDAGGGVDAWELTPAALPTAEVWVHAGDPEIYNIEEQVRADAADSNPVPQPLAPA